MEFTNHQKNKNGPTSSDSGEYSISRTQLKLLINRGRKEGDTLTTGYLLQTLGDMEAKAGNIALAHALHKEAIELDTDTPLPLLLYATGLFRAFNRPDLALEKIRELRDLLQSKKWEPTVNEPSLQWYLNELNSLSEEIKMKNNPID